MNPLTVTYLPLDQIKRYVRNPKKHSDAQVRKLAQMIKEFGFTVPLLIDDEGLIAGHGRLAAAELLGLAEVPTIYYPGLTPAQRRAYVIADNKITEQGTWDEGLLIEELESIKLDGGVSLTLTGFSENELLSLLDVGPDPKSQEEKAPQGEAVAPTEFQQFDEGISIDFKCPRCGHGWSGNAKP